MKISGLLASLECTPDARELAYLKKKTNEFVLALQAAIKKEHLDADVFVGGSFAKNTLVKKERWDVDVFVRFDWRYEDLTAFLARIVKRVAKKTQITRLHGSRDYYRIRLDPLIEMEVIPVLRISKPQQARNVTDLSYFHVGYVKKALRKSPPIARQISIAKTFCRAQGVYGAESYINGFSGYGLECLLIHYKSFEKMARALAKQTERVILDPARQYRSQKEVLLSLNESKLQSPIILVDPTWKERNVLAALSRQTFAKFQQALQAFLARPSPEFFVIRSFDVSILQKKAKATNAQLVHLRIGTLRQAGDIAGTTLKRFAEFLKRELTMRYEVSAAEFIYNEKEHADLYIVARAKKGLLQRGPPLTLRADVAAFYKKHPDAFERKGVLMAHLTPVSLKKYLQDFLKNNTIQEQMKISQATLIA